MYPETTNSTCLNQELAILISMKKLLLIFNPKSGTQNFATLLFKVVDRFTAAGFFATVYPTQASGEAREITSCFASEYDYLVCSGGDGTVSEVINALLNLEKRPILGLIPSGTVNDFAKSLGIPKNILVATSIIINLKSTLLDVGCFEGQYFSYVAAFGMFTDVPYATPQNSKNSFGKLAYFMEGIKRIGTTESYPCKFVLDDEEIKGDFTLCIISNAHSVAGIKMTKKMQVEMSDGLFEVVLIRTPKTLSEHQKIIASLLAQESKTDLVIIRKAKKVQFSSEMPVAWTLDGDFGGEYTKAVIENKHKAIEIITPTP